MIRRLWSLVAFSLAILGAILPQAQAEPRPGTVAGLDLSSPEAAARSFIEAWNEEDYFIAYLALDPQLRAHFAMTFLYLDFPSFFASEFDPEAFFEVIAQETVDSQADDGLPGFIPLTDAFADFGGVMRAGRQVGLALLDLPRAAAETVKVSNTGDAATAHVRLLPAAGGGMLVMRRSPGGLWRLLRITERDVPPFWAGEPPRVYKPSQ